MAVTACSTADNMETALAEVRHHRELYWSGVVGLNFERFVFRGLSCQFDEAGLLDATTVALTDPIYDPNDYSAARQFGRQLRQDGFAGLRYRSVRKPVSIAGRS